MGYYDLSLKERRELLDCILHNVKDGNERIKNRLTLDNLRLVERYLSGELEIHIHFRIRRNGKFRKVHSENWAILFWYEKSVFGNGPREGIGTFWNDFSGTIKKFSLIDNLLNSGNGYYQQPVFILNVEAVESPQFTPVPAIVRFQPIDDLYSILPQQLYFSVLKGRFEFLGSLLDRKFDARTTTGYVLPSDELTGKQVESRTKIVDCITDYSADREGGRLNVLDTNPNDISGIGVFLMNKGIRLTLEKSLASIVEISNVLFAPFNLRPDTSKRMIFCDHVLNYPYSRGNMDDKNKPTQKTKTGHEIPIPTKEDFMRDLQKASEPTVEKKPSRPARRPKKSRKER